MSITKIQIIEDLNKTMDRILTEDESQLLAVRYQSNNTVAEYFYNKMRDREFLNLVYSIYYSKYDLIGTIEYTYINHVINSYTNRATNLVDIDGVFTELLSAGKTHHIVSMVRFPPIQIEMPPRTPGMTVYTWLGSWRITILNHIMNKVRPTEVVLNTYPDNTLLLYFIYHLISDLGVSGYTGHDNIIVATPEFYIARGATLFGLHQDCEYGFSETNLRGLSTNYNNKLDALSLMYLHTNTDNILRSATLTPVPTGGLRPIGVHPAPGSRIDMPGLSLPVKWGSTVFSQDPIFLHTSPIETIPRTSRETILNDCHGRYILQEKPSEIVDRIDAAEITAIQDSFPSARSFVRVHYISLGTDDILPLISRAPLTITPIFTAHITIDHLITLVMRKDPHRLSLSDFVNYQEYHGITVIDNTFEGARDKRALGGMRKPKTKKHVNKKYKSIKRRINKK